MTLIKERLNNRNGVIKASVVVTTNQDNQLLLQILS